MARRAPAVRQSVPSPPSTTRLPRLGNGMKMVVIQPCSDSVAQDPSRPRISPPKQPLRCPATTRLVTRTFVVALGTINARITSQTLPAFQRRCHRIRYHLTSPHTPCSVIMLPLRLHHPRTNQNPVVGAASLELSVRARVPPPLTAEALPLQAYECREPPRWTPMHPSLKAH